MRAKNMNLYRCFYEAFAFNLFWFNQTLPKTDLFKKAFSYELLIWSKSGFFQKVLSYEAPVQVHIFGARNYIDIFSSDFVRSSKSSI